MGLLLMVLKVQKQRDLLAGMLNESAFESKKRLRVENPTKFLARFSAALGIDYLDLAKIDEKPVRIKAELLSKVFVDHGISRIKCLQENNKLVAEFKLGPMGNKASAVENLTEALGGSVTVRTGDAV